MMAFLYFGSGAEPERDGESEPNSVIGFESLVGRWFKVKSSMKQTLGHVALVVRDYDEALDFFTRTLHFRVVEDTRLSETKRWVLIAPPGSEGATLLLARAATPEQESRIGNQTGGRVFLFLHTDDFWRDYNEMVARNVKFIRPPKEEPYGTVAVFEDLYGNLWDLLQLKTSNLG